MIKKYLTDINNKVYLKEEILNSCQTSNKIEIFLNNDISRFLGFGSAITESSAYNYSLLSKNNKIKFINDYFKKEGLNYNFGRISIGSNDFSLASFEYTKKKDLSDYSIAEDKKYVIPFIKDILNNKKISFIASPWSPPKMYKRLPILYWGIKLRKKYYDNYCEYLKKFINEYNKNNIKIDYLTMQNEPLARQRWESCKFTVSEQKDFISNHLLNKLSDTKLLLWDHNKDDLYNIVNDLYIDDNKIAGIGFHYYTGHCFDEIKKIREKYPNLLLINTEMCCGFSPYIEKEWIKSAEYYLNDIIGDMNNGINAYLDWNILLDENGGPTHSKNFVKSASILINNDYIKTPIYYYLYHISHFITDKSIIVENKENINDLKVVSIKNEKKLIIVVMNTKNIIVNYQISYDNNMFSDFLKPHSLATYEINRK